MSENQEVNLQAHQLRKIFCLKNNYGAEENLSLYSKKEWNVLKQASEDMKNHFKSETQKLRKEIEKKRQNYLTNEEQITRWTRENGSNENLMKGRKTTKRMEISSRKWYNGSDSSRNGRR